MAMGVRESLGPSNRYVLLSDIAGSSRLAEVYPREYAAALDRHNELVEGAVARACGEIYKNTGDGYYSLFETACGALACAHALALGFAAFEPLAEDAPFRVRIVVHGGELRPSGREYFGPALNRVSRICQVCHPGQTLVSGVVRAAAPELPDGAQLINLGEHYLRDLNEPEELYQLDDARLPAREFPALETLNNRPHNLWRHADAFIGRERELKELSATLLGGQRLISIIGMGGYGKSRLSRQLLANLLPHYTHGVYVVELELLNSASAIASATGRALKVNFVDKRPLEDQLVSFLRNKRMLLCFDNFEHVLEGRALVEAILKGAPEVQVLVTTREPLRLKGEQEYNLDALPVGSAGFQPVDKGISASATACAVTRSASTVARITEANRHDTCPTADALLLFADRARQVAQDFELTPENASGVAAICHALSGIPLAIELAAAWMDSFTLSELRRELEHQLELEARYADIPGRHHSLRASLDWSWRLLTQEQRETLMRMATFKGGAFAEAAEAVLGLAGMQLRKALAALMDKSWLGTRQETAAAAAGWVGKTQALGQTRWFMRDAASREYAFEKLEGKCDGGTGFQPVKEIKDDWQDAGPTDSLYESAVIGHARYFSKFVEREGPRLGGGGTLADQREVLQLFELELDNILEAIDSLQHRIGTQSLEPSPCNFVLFSTLLPVARWLWEFYYPKGKFKEQHETYNHLLACLSTTAGTVLRFWAELGLGIACLHLGMMDEAMKHAGACLMLAEEDGRTGFQPVGKAEVHRQDICPIGNAFLLRPVALRLLGTLHRDQGRMDEAWECYSASLAISRELGDRRGVGHALNNLGLLHRDLGRMDEARECCEASLAIIHELGDHRSEGSALNNLGLLHWYQGRIDEARECFDASLAIRRELGDRRGEGAALTNLGSLHRDQGRMDEAWQCYKASLEISRELGDRRSEGSALNNLGNLNWTQGRMDEAQKCFDASLMIYRKLGNRLGEGFSLHGLGILNWTQGRMDEARAYFEASLAIFRELGDRQGEGSSLDSYAGLLLETGDLPQAREVLQQSQRISEELSLKDNLASLHSKWARYWLAAIGGTGFQPVNDADRQDTCPTGQDVDRQDAYPAGIPATPQAVLNKALHHFDTGKGYFSDIGGTWEAEAGQEITKARRAIIAFAAEHGLSEHVAAALIAEQTAEDELRAQAEAKKQEA